MIYLELKKKALAVIFSQVKIIRAKGYIGELVRSAAEAISSAPITAAPVIREQDGAGAVVAEALPVMTNIVIREASKAGGVVAPEVRPIKADIYFTEKALASPVVVTVKAIATGALARDRSLAVYITPVGSEPIASKDYSHEQGIVTVTPAKAVEIAAGDLQRSDGSAVLELITTLTVSALDTPSREHGTAWVDHATTEPIYVRTHVGEEASAKLGMIQNATIDDYSGEVISSLYGKTVDEIATIIIL